METSREHNWENEDHHTTPQDEVRRSSIAEASSRTSADRESNHDMHDAAEASTINHQHQDISPTAIVSGYRQENDSKSSREPKVGATSVIGNEEERRALRMPNGSLWNRVGAYIWILLLISFIFIAAAMSFLAWMWFGERSSKDWRQFMIQGWSNQAVTVTALILRTATSVQATVATGMLAAVAAEHGGVPLEDGPQISIARFSNTGPSSFWFSLLCRRTFVGFRLRLILIFLLLTSVATQFTSTILLTDLKQGRVIGFSKTSQNLTGFSWENASYNYMNYGADYENPYSPFLSRQNYWDMNLLALQPFAEYSEPANFNERIQDTGVTLRAFLPITSQDTRQNIQHFTGSMPLFDARVVCVPPNILEYDSDNGITLDLSQETSIPGLVVPTEPYQFKCLFDRVGWTVCPLSTSAGGLLPSLDPLSNLDYNINYNNFTDMTWTTTLFHRIRKSGASWWASGRNATCQADLGNVYVIINAGTNNVDENGNAKPTPITAPWVQVNVQPAVSGVIDGVPPPTSDPTFTRVTLCYDSLYLQAQDFEITVEKDLAQKEFALHYDIEKRAYDTVPLRNQLGVRGAAGNNTDRNILNITSITDIRDEVKRREAQFNEYCETAGEVQANTLAEVAIGGPARAPTQPNPNIYNLSTYSWLNVMALSILRDYTGGMVMCIEGDCRNIIPTDGGLSTPNPSLGIGMLFNDVIAETDSPALALQAVITQVMRQAYYDWLPVFDQSSTMIIAEFEERLVPTQARGFWAVLAVIGTHLMLCTVAGIAFGLFTRRSFLHNAWQAIHDVVTNKDSSEVLDTAGQLKDSKVARWISEDPRLRKRKFWLDNSHELDSTLEL